MPGDAFSNKFVKTITSVDEGNRERPSRKSAKLRLGLAERQAGKKSMRDERG